MSAIWFNQSSVVFHLNLKYLVVQTIIAWFVRDIWHKYPLWYFKIVSNFTRLLACEITYNNCEISLVVFLTILPRVPSPNWLWVSSANQNAALIIDHWILLLMPNITLNYAITYTNRVKALESMTHTATLICQESVLGETPIPRDSIL